MIANDDLVFTFHKGETSFNLKIAVRYGQRSAPEILDLLRAVVHEDVTISFHIEPSRFSPKARYRVRERVVSFFDNSQMNPQAVAASAKEQNNDQSKKGNIVTTKRPVGRPRSQWTQENATVSGNK